MTVTRDVNLWHLSAPRQRQPLSVSIPLGATTRQAASGLFLVQGKYKYDAIHGRGELRRALSGTAHTTRHLRGLAATIYLHHSGHASSESLDTMVVFDHTGKLYARGDAIQRLGAWPQHIRKEARRVSLSLRHFICKASSRADLKARRSGRWGIQRIGRVQPKDNFSHGNRPTTGRSIAPTANIYNSGDGYGSPTSSVQP